MTKTFSPFHLPVSTRAPGAAGYFSTCKLLAAVALAVPCLLAQAQTLRPSEPLRTPSFELSNPASFGRSAGAQRQADFIVAVVNSEPVTNNEVRSKLIRAEQQLTQQGAVLPPRGELARQVLERLISDKAQLQMAKTSGVRVDENSLDNAVLSIAQQNQISIEELRRRLVADGIAYSQFRADIRDELLVTRLRQREVDARVSVTDAEIDQFLREQDSNIDSANMEINLAQILVVVPENANPQQLAALQARAAQAAEKARAGGDFAALVNEFSDSPSKAAGGQMGLRSAERYPSLFVEATQNLRTGGIAGPVLSGAGFHSLKVIEKKQAGMPGIDITQTRARHILLRPGPQLTEAAAVEKLADIKKRVVAGQADFAAEARDNSVDGSAKDGGDLGWTNPGSFVPEFEQVMNGLAAGQMSDPLTSRFGVHLIQVLERRQRDVTNERDQADARQQIHARKTDERYAQWVRQLRDEAYIEYRINLE